MLRSGVSSGQQLQRLQLTQVQKLTSDTKLHGITLLFVPQGVTNFIEANS
jgi:hypothetical protein